MPPRIAIVGAGLSGLALAFRIRERMPSAHVSVIEKGRTPGGNIATIERDGFRIEAGPNGIFDAKPHLLDLCRDLGLGDRLIPGSEAARKNRYVYLDGRLQALPSSLSSFLTSGVLSWRGKLNLLRERFRRRPADTPLDESVADFARRRVGPEVTATLVDPFVSGIHAGDPERLSLPAAFPRLAEFERVHGSVARGFSAASRVRRQEARARGERPAPRQLWSFKEGLQVLVNALRDRLGDSLVSGVNVRRVESTTDGWVVRGVGQDSWPADAVVLTAQAHEQAAMLADLDPQLAAEIANISYARIAVVAVGFRQTDIPRPERNGFGYLVPRKEDRPILGVQWCSSIFPDRAPPGMVLWRALCGGAHRGEMVDWPDEKLVACVREELRRATGINSAPMMSHVVRWPAAIPQYVVGHQDRLARIDRRVACQPGLYLGGNAYRGVAMNDCAERAIVLADRIAAHFAGRLSGPPVAV